MIISIRTQASSEERGQLMALLCRLTGNSRPVTSTTIDGSEVLALDGSQLDSQALPLLEQGPQFAVGRKGVEGNLTLGR